jgi:hypothetical protein
LQISVYYDYFPNFIAPCRKKIPIGKPTSGLIINTVIRPLSCFTCKVWSFFVLIVMVLVVVFIIIIIIVVIVIIIIIIIITITIIITVAYSA